MKVYIVTNQKSINSPPILTFYRLIIIKHISLIQDLRWGHALLYINLDTSASDLSLTFSHNHIYFSFSLASFVCHEAHTAIFM